MKNIGVVYLQQFPCFNVKKSKLPLMSILCLKMCVLLSFLQKFTLVVNDLRSRYDVLDETLLSLLYTQNIQ